FLLRLDDPHGLGIDEEEVIGDPMPGEEPELPHRHPLGGVQVDLVPRLDHPAGGGEHGVDALSGLLFGEEGHGLANLGGYGPGERLWTVVSRNEARSERATM